MLVVFHEPRHHARLIAPVNKLLCQFVAIDKLHEQRMLQGRFGGPWETLLVQTVVISVVIAFFNIFVSLLLSSLSKLLAWFNQLHTILTINN